MAEKTNAGQLQRDLVKLADVPATPVAPLKAPAARPPITSTSGSSTAGAKASGGGGISSPLEEKDGTLREYHPTLTFMRTSDNLFSIAFRHPSVFKMTDGAGTQFDLKLDTPS